MEEKKLLTSEIYYEGLLRTRSTHLRSGNIILTDAPVDNNGKGEAFSPTDLVASALGSCMATVMGIKAGQNGWNIDGTRITVEKIMTENPRRISEIRAEIIFPDHYFDQKARTVLEHAAIHCPVAKSIHPDIRQNIRFIYSGK